MDIRDHLALLKAEYPTLREGLYNLHPSSPQADFTLQIKAKSLLCK